MNSLEFFLLFIFCYLTQPSHSAHRICVPENAKDACLEMANEGQKRDVSINCVVGRDRLDCLEKIHQHAADFSVVEPEDMYIAASIDNAGFKILKEIRTKAEPQAEFRYRGVAVVRKDLKIKNISSLRGLNSCHTGVGRNVGYKIPITKLTKMKVLDPLSDETVSPRENELRALSKFFGKACLVGKWAPDNQTNDQLKKKYSNLCALCQHPDICDYPDDNSGYDGALRCLTNAGGDVAWTKTIYVDKHFGLKEQEKKNNADQYAYLCPDGTKVPITDPPCTWAARPWPGFIGDSSLSDVEELRTEISKLNKLGEALSSDWFTMVLQLSNASITVDNANLLHPYDYLSKAKYYDVIGRDVIVPRRTVRWCVTSAPAHEKCKGLKMSAYSRDIRPAFECVEESSVEKCLQTIRDNGADIINLDATDAAYAKNMYNTKVISTEVYQDNTSDVYAVALVMKDSPYKSLADLKGLRSCHTAYLRSSGWVAPVEALIKNGIISKVDCPYAKALSEFFAGGSCVPGVPEELKAETPLISDCKDEAKEYEGPIKCLVSGKGDVAFTKHVKVLKSIDDGELSKDDVELLCLNGNRAAVDQYATCNLAKVPPHVIVTSNDKSEVQLTEITNALLAAANLYSKQPELFKLFGKYDRGKDDLLFLNPTTNIRLVKDEDYWNTYSDYLSMLEDVKYCEEKIDSAIPEVNVMPYKL